MGNKNEMMVFNNEEFGSVRVVNIDGEGWLAGKDVAELLGYKNTRDALSKHVDEEDKSEVAIHDGRQNRNMVVINESGLYSLVLRSKLPQAKKFRRWVTSEVLPQIRKTGGYIPIKEEDDELTIMSKAFMIAQKTIDKQQQLIDKQQEILESQRPKVEFAEAVSESEDEIDMGTMAKLLVKEDIKVGRNRLFKILIELNILMEDNLPYQRFLDSGYFRVIECKRYINNKVKLFEKTLITGKGQLYITKKIKEYFVNKENNK